MKVIFKIIISTGILSAIISCTTARREYRGVPVYSHKDCPTKKCPTLECPTTASSPTITKQTIIKKYTECPKVRHDHSFLVKSISIKKNTIQAGDIVSIELNFKRKDVGNIKCNFSLYDSHKSIMLHTTFNYKENIEFPTPIDAKGRYYYDISCDLVVDSFNKPGVIHIK